MQGGCLWVPGEMKVGVFLLLIYRVGRQVECGLLSLGCFVEFRRSKTFKYGECRVVEPHSKRSGFGC